MGGVDLTEVVTEPVFLGGAALMSKKSTRIAPA